VTKGRGLEVLIVGVGDSIVVGRGSVGFGAGVGGGEVEVSRNPEGVCKGVIGGMGPVPLQVLGGSPEGGIGYTVVMYVPYGYGMRMGGMRMSMGMQMRMRGGGLGDAILTGGGGGGRGDGNGNFGNPARNDVLKMAVSKTGAKRLSNQKHNPARGPVGVGGAKQPKLGAKVVHKGFHFKQGAVYLLETRNRHISNPVVEI